jgi:hypothetical protein
MPWTDSPEQMVPLGPSAARLRGICAVGAAGPSVNSSPRGVPLADAKPCATARPAPIPPPARHHKPCGSQVGTGHNLTKRGGVPASPEPTCPRWCRHDRPARNNRVPPPGRLDPLVPVGRVALRDRPGAAPAPAPAPIAPGAAFCPRPSCGFRDIPISRMLARPILPRRRLALLRRARPRGGVAAGKLAGQLVQVIFQRHRLSEPGGDPDGERVAADTGEVLAEQARCSRDVSCGRGGDHFDVMAFPVHRPPAGMAAWCAGDGRQIGGRESEVGVGGDGQAQGHGGPARAGGSLRPPVPRGRLRVGGDHPAVVLDRGPEGGQVIAVAWR